MNGSTSSIDLPPWRSLFGIATAPARVLSRWRTDLLVSLHEDAATFRGRALVVFGVLTLVAVAYPIIAQLVHAYIGPQPRTIDALSSAMKPYFVIVFAESLPFMIAVAGIGAFSPALGVLLMVIFIPADLAAASVGEWHQLKTHPSLDPFPAGIAARLITYGVLWILAVEIPLVVRRWVAGFAAARSVAPSRAMRAAATAGATAVLVFLWASALPWLIQPVFTWTLQQQISYEATVPTWLYWPILVAGAAFIAGVAAVWPTPARVPPHSRSALGAWHAGPRTMGQVIIRQIVVALALAALFAGLITDRRKAAILIGGLLMAGPVVTLLLPHVRLPRFFPPARSLGRWITAMGISLAISWLILLRFENTTTRDFLVTVITLAVVAPIFRLLLEAAAGPRSAGDAPGPHPGPPPAVIASTIVLLVLVRWLAFPPLAWADNCFGEVGECAKAAFWSSLAMIGGALALAGAALARTTGFGFSRDGSQWTFKTPWVSVGVDPSSLLGPANAPPASNAPPPSSADPASAAPADSPPVSPTPRPPGVHGPPQ